MAEMKLKRLKIDHYRSVAPGTELVFNDTWNVLLGQNGTGKTTLLRLIATIVASDFSPLKDEPFAIEYAVSYTGAGSATVRIVNQRQESSTEQPLETFASPNADEIGPQPTQGESLSWECLVTIQLEGSPVSWEVASNAIAAKKSVVGDGTSSEPVRVISPFDGKFMDTVFAALRPKDADIRLMGAWRACVMGHHEGRTNAARFDEGLDAFGAITGSSPADRRETLTPSKVTVSSRLDSNGKARRGGAIERSGIVPDVILFHHVDRFFDVKPQALNEEKAFLTKIAASLGFSRAEFTWDLLSKEVDAKTERSTFGNFGFRFTLDDGSIINHNLLSYGQKRLLAFFYYVAASPHIVIADELVNGLHYDWIEICLKEIGERQAFLTSQNPLLLDFLPFGSVEDVQRSFLLCRSEKRDGRNQMVWINLDEASARSFYRAYETEAQQVSEILRSKGLW